MTVTAGQALLHRIFSYRSNGTKLQVYKPWSAARKGPILRCEKPAFSNSRQEITAQLRSRLYGGRGMSDPERYRQAGRRESTVRRYARVIEHF